MTFKCEVYIRPRPDILDPQGEAVNKALAELNFKNVDQVKVGKYLTLEIEADSAAAARSQLDEMCGKLLANPITEDYELEVTEA